VVVRGRVHSGEGAVSDFKRDTDEKDERRRDLRLPMPDEKPSAAQDGRISVDAYSLAYQARRGHHGPGLTTCDSACRLFGQVTGRKRKTPDF
jgi:hypothetical protein